MDVEKKKIRMICRRLVDPAMDTESSMMSEDVPVTSNHERLGLQIKAEFSSTIQPENMELFPLKIKAKLEKEEIVSMQEEDLPKPPPSTKSVQVRRGFRSKVRKWINEPTPVHRFVNMFDIPIPGHESSPRNMQHVYMP